MIRVLPDVVQNKIAAGEVVERPASAVKELVENALDAGAGRISLEIEEGGMRTIRVSDDGCGMDKADLQLSVERHATSKIHDVEDIFRISTMGFRGEALPSIGSVSRLTITTGIKGEDIGNSLRITGGRVEGVMPAPPRSGTVVEVHDLFFNTPARRKFMKSTAAEMGAINETVTRLALANPGVAFSVKGNGKVSMELLARGTLVERITDLFGKSLDLLPVNYTTSNGELTISGFCGKPPESRGSSKFIYTLLNRRWIRHPGMNRGITDAFQGHLPPRRYPFAVLCLEINPAKVDVNAHPSKETVRFENDSLFVGGCRKALEVALSSNKFPGGAVLRDNSQLLNSLRESIEDYAGGPGRDSVGSAGDFTGQYRQRSIGSAAAFKDPQRSLLRDSAGLGLNYSEKNSVDEGRVWADPGNGLEQAAAADSSTSYSGQGSLDIEREPELRYIGQVGGKYILAESAEGVVFIDQHALHERWNYNRLCNKKYHIDSQRLLLPVEVKLTAAEEAMLVESMPVLEEAGFELRVEEGMLFITAHPDIIRPHNITRVVRDVLNDIDATPIEDYRQRINASLACHSAVLFGTNLSDDLCRDLLSRLEEGNLFTCPHGRPTRIIFTWQELAYKFDR